MILTSRNGNLSFKIALSETTCWPRRERNVEIAVPGNKPVDVAKLLGIDEGTAFFAVMRSPDVKRLRHKGYLVLHLSPKEKAAMEVEEKKGAAS